MGTMLQAGFAELMAPGLFEVISDKFKQYPTEYTKFFNSKTSKEKDEAGLTIEGFGAAPEKNEGQSTQYNDLTQGYKTTFTHKTYSQGARVTRECYDDDLYSVFKSKLGTYLGRSIAQRKEILAADVLNNGFATTGADGVVLFSASHPFKSGGTWSNTLSAQADLSATSLQDLITILEQTQGANSINIQLIAKLLIVAPANRWTASVLLESQKDPESANNAINPLLDLDLSYMVDHYLTDADAWVIECDQHGMIFFTRQAPRMEADDDFDTGDAKTKITARWSAGYDDATGIAGSSGG